MSETTPARTHSGLFAKNSAVLRLWEGFMDLVFPPMCLHCARVDFHFCPNCQQALREFPLDQQTAAMAPLQSIASSGLHDGVLQAAVQALKYQNMPEIAQPLGQ
jgi:predicted amidophosphoribosyltransferase